MVRVAMVALVGAIAVSVPGFSMFISFVGSFACSSLAFILPAACHLVLFGPKLSWAGSAMDYSLILFGLMGMVFGVAHSIGLMIASKGHE
jgi:proton-coupled amino acid transporter